MVVQSRNNVRRANRTTSVIKPLRNVTIERGQSDKKQGSSSIKLFSKFLIEKYGPFKQVLAADLLTAEGNIKGEFVTDELFGYFCGHCQDHIPSWSTAKNYYSQVKKYLQLLYPAKKADIETVSTKMQKKITVHFNQKSAEDRLPVVNHHLPFQPGDNHYVCNFLFEQGHHEACLLQAMDFLNGGRITEGRALQ